MNRIPILACKYYVDDKQFDFKEIRNLESTLKDPKFCNLDKFPELLKEINTRLVDRQSLALQAAIEPFKVNNFYKKVDKSRISVVSGSLSAAVYPILEYVDSACTNGPNFVNAAAFPNTVANAPASRLCIWNGFENRVTSLSEGMSSGLDAIMMACDQIKRGYTDFVWAVSSEENGAAAVFLGGNSPCRDIDFPNVAYVNNYESRYVGNISNSEQDKFIKELANSWDLNDGRTIIKKSKDTTLFSIEPMLDFGRMINLILDNEADRGIIISLDKFGILSILEVKR